MELNSTNGISLNSISKMANSVKRNLMMSDIFGFFEIFVYKSEFFRF